MASFSALLLVLLCAFCSIARGAEKSFTVAVAREAGDRDAINAVSKFRQGQSGTVPVAIGKSLYWFGNFSVGDSPSLRLLIDTGSSDCILNKGIYEPSKSSKPYPGHKHFSITYEGVNRKGFGFETINGTVNVDKVSAGGLTVPDLAVGNVSTWKYIQAPQLPYANQGKGIIGFLGASSSSFEPPAPSWFFKLCSEKLISQCRLGLAFGTSGKGQSVIGKLATNLFKGPLTVTKRETKLFEAWTNKGDVFLNGKIIAKNQTMIFDCGTDNIQGPDHVVRKIFDQLGYQTHAYHGGPNPFDPAQNLTNLLGFFPCDKPPTLGFSFPAQADLGKPGISKEAKLFNVSLKVWDVYDHGHNNCTSILGGTNALTDPKTHETAWLIGQSFYSGHYVDHNIAGTIGIADLVNPATGS